MVDGRHFFRFSQEPDLRYLVENIWNSQSVLSAHEDLFDLVLVRWNKYEEWSPWNCILLTKEEASAHAKLENVTEVLVFCFILLLFSLLLLPSALVFLLGFLLYIYMYILHLHLLRKQNGRS